MIKKSCNLTGQDQILVNNFLVFVTQGKDTFGSLELNYLSLKIILNPFVPSAPFLYSPEMIRKPPGFVFSR